MRVKKSEHEEKKEDAEVEQEEEEEEDNNAVSFLDPNAVRWMNRRRIRPQKGPDGKIMNATNSTPLVTPSQAIYLRKIFKGLDYENNGEIPLKELSKAVRWVSRHSNGKLFHDPDKIIKFFKAMDIDGNGNVDMGEFLIGMTAQSAGNQDDDMDPKQLERTFFEFSNLHRRRKVISSICDNQSKNDFARYKHLYNLFNIKYLDSSENSEENLISFGSVQDQINLAKKDLERFQKEISGEYNNKRREECILARNAALYFESERARMRLGDRSNSYYDSTDTARAVTASAKTSNYTHQFSITDSLESSNISDERGISLKLEKKVNERLSKYPLLKGNKLSSSKTYTPLLNTVLPPSLTSNMLPECFGALLSGGEKIITGPDFGQGFSRAASPVDKRLAHQSLFTTNNYKLESSLFAQQIRQSAVVQNVLTRPNTIQGGRSSPKSGVSDHGYSIPPLVPNNAKMKCTTREKR